MEYLWNVLAAIVPMIAGFLWYNNFSFGEIWRKSVRLPADYEDNVNMPLTFGLSFLGALLMTIPLSYMANHGGEEFDTFKHGAFHGLLTGVMLVGPILLSKGLFAQRKLVPIFIDIAYWTIVLAIMSGILGGFK